jgi:hypothetical protein
MTCEQCNTEPCQCQVRPRPFHHATPTTEPYIPFDEVKQEFLALKQRAADAQRLRCTQHGIPTPPLTTHHTSFESTAQTMRRWIDTWFPPIP